MVFQPTSPIRNFHGRLSSNSSASRATFIKPLGGVVSQPDLDTAIPRRGMQQLSQTQLAAPLPSEASPTDNKLHEPEHDGQYIQSTLALTQHEHNHVKRSPPSPRSRQRPTSMILKSYFENDTDSGEDKPIMGRANSVRVVQPSIVHHSPGKASRASRLSSKRPSMQERSVSPHSDRISDASESMTSVDEAECLDQSSGRPSDKVDAYARIHSDMTEEAATHAGQNERMLTLLEGLRMNPLTEDDRINIQRPMSAHIRPRTHLSGRRVRIRPSDIRVDTLKDGVRPFRETVVTTPYPDAEDRAKEGTDNEAEDRINTVRFKSARDDRFPSVDRAEDFSIDLNLAQHPAATARLEIHITDKNVFDDEMLFRQIRGTYHSRLLRTSRLPFSFIRGVAYATVSPFAQYDFKTADFVRHFHKPRCGRGRRSWVIWLRHHSLQQPNVLGDKFLGKPPLSASSRMTDKRLSIHSDTTSTFNFSFLPPSLISRLLFFNKETTATMPVSVPVSVSPSQADFENARGVVKIHIMHEFSPWVLALLFLGTILCSTLVTIMWVLFGVPGSRPDDKLEMAVWAMLVDKRASWQSAARDRVLTGLVLGIFVAVLGSLVDLFLVFGAYVFL